jgi:hypothetical protein
MQDKFTPIWNDNTFSDIKLHRQYLKLANGYCLECQKPLIYKHYLCTNCINQLKVNGLEHRRVSYKTVGLSTINYQQHLHRKFFKCNAPYQYRGLKENRIKTNIKEETIDKSCDILHNYLLSSLDNQIPILYKDIHHLRNTQRRLLYSILLYGISYYILEIKDFKHKAHYQASIVKMLDNDIKRMWIRTNYKETEKILKRSVYHRTLTQNKEIYTAISKAIAPLLLEVY